MASRSIVMLLAILAVTTSAQAKCTLALSSAAWKPGSAAQQYAQGEISGGKVFNCVSPKCGGEGYFLIFKDSYNARKDEVPKKLEAAFHFNSRFNGLKGFRKDGPNFRAEYYFGPNRDVMMYSIGPETGARNGNMSTLKASLKCQ